MTAMTYTMPRYMKTVNKVVMTLQRFGVSMPMPTLTVPGRKSGQPRSTPVSPFELHGAQYVVGSLNSSDWVKNVRVAGECVLAHGHHQERVRLVELPEDERGPVLREFPTKVPRGVPMFLKTGLVDNGSPDAFAAAAPRCAVFRIEPVA